MPEPQVHRTTKPLGWLERFNLRHRKPEELETCLFRYQFRDGHVVEHLIHNVLILGSLNTHACEEGKSFLLRGHPADRDYTEEGYRLHVYDEEEVMDEKIRRIRGLLQAAKDEHLWGGSEDADGGLCRGAVDFDDLERQIITILQED